MSDYIDMELNLPESLTERIKNLAEHDGKSVQDEIIYLLQRSFSRESSEPSPVENEAPEKENGDHA